MVEIGIFEIQFDPCDIVPKSVVWMALNSVCQLNLHGDVSCRAQLLTHHGSVDFGVFATTQTHHEEHNWECL